MPLYHLTIITLYSINHIKKYQQTSLHQMCISLNTGGFLVVFVGDVIIRVYIYNYIHWVLPKHCNSGPGRKNKDALVKRVFYFHCSRVYTYPNICQSTNHLHSSPNSCGSHRFLARGSNWRIADGYSVNCFADAEKPFLVMKSSSVCNKFKNYHLDSPKET